ncbi:MAG: phage tail assembly protein T [Candidatus Heimdallarchaeaceae archaeon]
MTVAEMLSRMSSSELTYWHEVYKQDPFGEWRDDVRTGIISSTIATVMSGKKHKIEDFIVKFEDAKKQSPDEMKTILMGALGIKKEEKRQK